MIYSGPDLEVKQCGMSYTDTNKPRGWAVVCHGVNVVYTDTEEEARACAEGMIDAVARLRGNDSTKGTAP